MYRKDSMGMKQIKINTQLRREGEGDNGEGDIGGKVKITPPMSLNSLSLS